MKKSYIIQLLEKYKDNIPFEYDKFYNSVLDGNIDALTYVSFLNKHELQIKIRDIYINHQV